MPDRNEGRTSIQAIGLASSIVAVAAVGLTLLADTGTIAFGHSVTRSERIILLFVAVGVCVVHVFLHMVRRHRRKRSHRGEDA
jgi:hypothetical protein